MLNKILFEEYFESRDIALRNKLVEENLYMVEILVKKYLGKGVDYDDLYQVGAMALISAVERFDPTKGFEFSSFATPTILGEIKKYFRDKGWSMKVPRHMKEVSSSLPRVKDELTSKLGRKPSVAEIAEAMGEKEDVILRAIESSAAYGTLSLNQTFTDNGNDGDAAMFEKYVAKNDKGFIDVENYEIINKVLDEMTGTNRYIFKKRFIEEKSQSEIAEVLGVSQMSISRAEKNIIKKFATEFAN
ncbi:MAG: SigB/SigF/SigG family RNA polymerase sigma factor [Eubacterium sp.]|nr:SigB/SigF/SigG family RNA polymerase sigma factor [Eubacterium sp.]